MRWLCHNFASLRLLCRPKNRYLHHVFCLAPLLGSSSCLCTFAWTRITIDQIMPLEIIPNGHLVMDPRLNGRKNQPLFESDAESDAELAAPPPKCQRTAAESFLDSRYIERYSRDADPVLLATLDCIARSHEGFLKCNGINAASWGKCYKVLEMRRTPRTI